MSNSGFTPNWEIEPLRNGSLWARVFSPSNIALAKYWGKRDVALNLPTNGSISVTLKGYGSFTTVEFDAGFASDRLILNGKEDKIGKVKRVLDEVRTLASSSLYARVQSYNNFPTAAGLASSASGLSAVTTAAAEALELSISKSKLSEIARKGSGSACRSLFGGFVEWRQGEKADGSDSVAEALAPVSHWPFKVFIAVANEKQKSEASTGGMERTRETSPYFESWIESAQKSVSEIRAAIQARDFALLAKLSESNCVRMHASAMAAMPPILYWQAETLEVIRRLWALRADGVKAFFTIDAGPNVVIICEPESAVRVSAMLGELAKLRQISVLATEVGEGARKFNPSEWRVEA